MSVPPTYDQQNTRSGNVLLGGKPCTGWDSVEGSRSGTLVLLDLLSSHSTTSSLCNPKSFFPPHLVLCLAPTSISNQVPLRLMCRWVSYLTIAQSHKADCWVMPPRLCLMSLNLTRRFGIPRVSWPHPETLCSIC